jgi:RNA polymerase sigma-70 factor (ECF subfamily)
MTGSSFEAKVSSLLDHLYGAALRLAKNREDAEDLVAEAVSKAWASRRSLKDPERFRSRILRTLRNTFISDYRKRAVRSQAETFEEHRSDAKTTFSLFEELHQPFLLRWGNPEKDFLNKPLSQDIQKAVDTLPEAFEW